MLSLGQLYRDRADAENTFDELKNQWGWGGFTTTASLPAVGARCGGSTTGGVCLSRPSPEAGAGDHQPAMVSSVGRHYRAYRQTEGVIFFSKAGADAHLSQLPWVTELRSS